MIAWLASLLLAVSFAATAADVPVPPLHARVTDQANLLAPAQRAQLEQRLAGIEQKKGAQVAVLIVPSTQPETIEEYGIRVAEAWKLGRGKVDGKRVDDGVLLLVAMQDRKVRIEVGYGLEGAIPDALARRIVAEAIAPAFRKADYFGGLMAAVDDIGRAIEGEALPAPWQPAHGAPDQAGTDWAAAVFVVVVAGFVATAVLGRVLGALAGGGVAAAGAWVAGASWPLAALAGLAALVFFAVFASTLGGGMRSTGGRRGGPWGGAPGGFGGGFPGGGWGGSGGGGGFSGGGGGFGGGGASGDW